MLRWIRSMRRLVNLRKGIAYIGPCLFILYLVKSSVYLYDNDEDTDTYTYYVQPELTPVEESRRVLLLSYQRCGSSFTGQILNHNPDAYYVFEPLDSFYVNLYGTSPGWNVPSDITHYWNGTERILPHYEHESISRTMNSLLSCDMDNLPTEFFAHTFWIKFPGSLGSLARFKLCLTKKKSQNNDCYTYLRPLCPERFGQDHTTMQKCFLQLQTNKSHNSKSPLGSSVKKYKECMAEKRRKIHTCVQEMNMTCQSSLIRGTKTVRLTMSTVEFMLKQDPDLKVIHLFRDPRPVALSRMARKSFRGKYSGKDMLLESELYCKTVLNDIVVRKRLEEKYPKTFYQLIYDDFVIDTVQKAKNVYTFLQVAFPDEVKLWLKNNRPKGNESIMIAEKWQDKLSYRQSRQIRDVCSELFELVDGAWDY